MVIFRTLKLRAISSGGNRRGATPVPIPNTEVKPSTGDGTNGAVRWESSKLPGFFKCGLRSVDCGINLQLLTQVRQLQNGLCLFLRGFWVA